MQTKGNTIFITGGTSGIGLAFAEKFLLEGNKVIICGRREDRLKQIKEKHPDIITQVSDMGDSLQRKAMAVWLTQSHPDVNILMNNAGVQLGIDLTKPVNLDRVKSEIEINLVAPIHLSSLLAEHLATKPEAAIVNISSGLAFCPIAFMPVYCATKAALHSYCISLRHQLKNTTVKVFEIIPPGVDTELGHDMRADKTQTHGGMPVSGFITEAFEAIRDDLFEAPIAHAKNLRARGEAMFGYLNK